MSDTIQFPICEHDKHDNSQSSRDRFADTLTAFLKGWERPFVISISSPWGTGKTFFLNRWKEKLESEGCNCIYFNAWESDHVDDPMEAFIGEIDGLLGCISKKQGGAKKTTKQLKHIYNNIKKNALPILVSMLVRSGANYLLENLDDCKNAENDEHSGDFNNSSESIAQRAEEISKKLVEQYVNRKESIKSFKDELKNFALTAKETGGGFPLIFIIDELDRCRPDFAIILLERIKHFFGVENIVFVIAMDQEALDAVVIHRYGNIVNDEAKDGYLARFLDLRLHLPPCDNFGYVQYLLSEDKRKFGANDNNYLKDNITELMASCFPVLSLHFGLSMREQNKVFSFLIYIMRTFPSGRISNLEMNVSNMTIFCLAFMHAARPKLYHQFSSGNGDAPKLEIKHHIYNKPYSNKVLELIACLHCLHERFKIEHQKQIPFGSQYPKVSAPNFFDNYLFNNEDANHVYQTYYYSLMKINDVILNTTKEHIEFAWRINIGLAG